MKVHHIGYLVKDVIESIKAFEVLGYNVCRNVVHDSSRGGDICFLKNGSTVVELIAPVEGCQEYRSLAKRIGNAPYHICYVADDFARDIKYLEENGWALVKPPQAAPAIDGRQVVFLYNEAIGMLELLE